MRLKDEKLDKVLEVFYEHPAQRFTVRGLAKKTKLPKSTVQNYLADLKKKNFISLNNRTLDNELFRIRKINYYIEKISKSGLISYLKKELNPSAIILFGSFRKGESIAESDIDLFIETTSKKTLDLSKFERRLRHSIQLFQEKDIHNLPDRLFNNIINGIVLHGFVKVK